MYIDTVSPVPNISSKSRDLADENKKTFDGMEMIRNNCIGFTINHFTFQIMILKLYVLQSYFPLMQTKGFALAEAQLAIYLTLDEHTNHYKYH